MTTQPEIPSDDEEVSFTLRMPRKLRDQIDQRAGLTKRSRNSEINMMLESYIDSSVGAFNKLQQRSAQ